MVISSLAQRTLNPQIFNVLIEFTCPAGSRPERLLTFLDDFASSTPNWKGLQLSGVTVTQNPSGTVTASPADVLSHVRLAGGWKGLDFVPHVSAKGMNRAEIETFLKGLLSLGVENCFLVTGDKPQDSAAVFEMDSLNLLDLVQRINADTVADAGPSAETIQLWPGVAVGLAKYEEATALQQLIKLEKKILLGNAQFVITNLVFDVRKVEDFFRHLGERNLSHIPVFGNVFFLTEASARRMRDEKLPGVYISPDLYSKVRQETFDDYIFRAALQVAMWKDLGAAGVDLGNVENLGLAKEILDAAVSIGSDWRRYEAKLTFPPPGPDLFYLYDSNGQKTALRAPSVPIRRKALHWLHQGVFEEQSVGFKLASASCKGLKQLKDGKGWMYEALHRAEQLGKGIAAHCELCGDCYLPENFFVCSLGDCAKGLPNVPCGDSTVDGQCGLRPERPCAGKLVYDSARYFSGGLEPLYQQYNPPRNPELWQTSSLRNFFLRLDHREPSPLELVAELLHASIPNVRQALEMAQSEGDFDRKSPGADFLRAVIRSQALRNPDFIDINIDDAGKGEPALSVRLMREMIRLVCEEGRGIPPCIDSSDPVVLRAGLAEYYHYKNKSDRWPLLNSANRSRRDFVWPLEGVGPFRIVYMLMEGIAEASDGAKPDLLDQLERNALAFFHEARNYGLSPDQIYFDTTVIPLVSEFNRFEGPGYNNLSIRGLHRIMQNKEMRGVKSILGITNLVRDFPQGRKIGLLRGYLKIAMEAGLSAAIADVRLDFGRRGPEDQEIVDIVRAFTDQDGSSGAFDRMNSAYQQYRAFGARKPSRPRAG